VIDEAPRVFAVLPTTSRGTPSSKKMSLPKTIIEALDPDEFIGTSTDLVILVVDDNCGWKPGHSGADRWCEETVEVCESFDRPAGFAATKVIAVAAPSENPMRLS
jgi:hypothetical protein